jgi:biopolymer transport protein ExbB
MVLFDVMRGGAVLWPILLCLLLTLGVIVDRWVVLRRGRFDTAQFLLKLKSLYRHGDLSAVLSYCSQKDAPIASIVRRGVLKHNQGAASVREAVEIAARDEMYQLERRLPVLATMCGLGPLLGLLGSVMGLILAFQSIETRGGVLLPAELAGIVWQSLVVTASGLALGILALIAYNGFTARVRKIVHEMESASNEFLDLLDEPPMGGNGSNGDEPHLVTRSQSVEHDPFRPKE